MRQRRARERRKISEEGTRDVAEMVKWWLLENAHWFSLLDIQMEVWSSCLRFGGTP